MKIKTTYQIVEHYKELAKRCNMTKSKSDLNALKQYMKRKWRSEVLIR